MAEDVSPYHLKLFPLHDDVMRYVQISKKGNYGNFHNFQKHVNSMKSIFEKF